jgi:hypothetical protein
LELDQNLLQKIFKYEPNTGVLTHAVNTPPRGKLGTEVGWINGHGYRRISIKGREYPAHKVIWMWMTGTYPLNDIDHIDGDRSNNSWTNLRLSTRSQNLMNQGRKPNNKSGFKGVTSRGGSHSAQFRIGGKIVRIGSFSTAREAAEAYDREVVKYQGQFAKTNKALGLL